MLLNCLFKNFFFKKIIDQIHAPFINIGRITTDSYMAKFSVPHGLFLCKTLRSIQMLWHLWGRDMHPVKVTLSCRIVCNVQLYKVGYIG